MSKTEDGLKEAFAGESQANRKYLAFAKKAEEEGYKQVAKSAISGESYEFLTMYPAMIADAQAEGNKSAERSFHIANEVEKVHHNLYKKALEELGKNKETDYYICKVCGYTAEDEAPDICPVCGAKKVAFYKVD